MPSPSGSRVGDGRRNYAFEIGGAGDIARTVGRSTLLWKEIAVKRAVFSILAGLILAASLITPASAAAAEAITFTQATIKANGDVTVEFDKVNSSY